MHTLSYVNNLLNEQIEIFAKKHDCRKTYVLKKQMVKIILFMSCSIQYQQITSAELVKIQSNSKIKDSQINIQEYQGNIHEKYALVPMKPLQLSSYLPEILTDYEKFVDRKQELTEIELAFVNNQVVVITGRGGMGKSSLAVEYGKCFKSDNKIVRHFNADIISKINQTYQGLAKEFDINVAGQSPTMVMKLVYTKLAGLSQEMLFIFDNVQQYDDVKDYIINLPSNIKSIITTRQPKLMIDIPHIVLEEFDPQSAMEYLEYSLQNRLSNKQDIQEIINNTSTLPYDLKCSSAYLLDNLLIDSKKAIIATGGKIKGKLFEEFATSNDKIKQQAWQILQYVSYLDPDFISIDIIKELFPKDKELLSNAIKKLESLSLISIISDQNDQFGFRIHRKLQKSVIYTIKTHPEYALDQQIVMNDLFSILDKLLPEVTDNQDIKWQISNSMQPHVEKLLKIGIPTTRQAKINEANLYYKLARFYWKVHIDYLQSIEYAEISLNKKKALYSINSPEIASILDLLGKVYRKSGDAQKGLKYSMSCLQMREFLYKGDHREIKNSLHNVGMAYRKLGEADKDLEYAILSLKMSQRLYSEINVEIATSLANVGVAYTYSKNLKEAINYLEASLEMYKKLYCGNHDDIAYVLGAISWYYYKINDYLKAIEYGEEATKIYQMLHPEGHPYTVDTLDNLGAALIESGNIQRGLSVLLNGLEISKKFKMDKHSDTAFIYHHLGRGYFKDENYKQALEYAQKALSLREEMYANVKNHLEIAESLHNLGDIYLALDNRTKALEFYTQALTMSLALSLDHRPGIKEIQQKIKKLKIK